MPIPYLHSFIRLTGFILGCYASVIPAPETDAQAMMLKSSAFAHQSAIPKEFTCDGSNVSPALSWSEISPNAKSLALIVDDPDVPAPFIAFMTWVHWVIYNIPVTVSELPQHVSPQDLPAGTLQGRNDWNETGYNGPCPPFGKHRYFFKLYALDTVLPDLNRPDKAGLEEAMQGHILSQANLIGVYKR